MRRHVAGLLILVLMMSSVSFLISEVRAEPSLKDVLTQLGFTHLVESGATTFPAGTYNITLYAEFASYCNENELSYYQKGTQDFFLIYSGPEGGSEYITPPLSKTFQMDFEFGLSMLSPGPHRYFTEYTFNPDGQNHSRIYENLDKLGMFLIGFENLFGAGDRDYQDMVFSLFASSNPPEASFNWFPPNPVASEQTLFNASGSIGGGGASIISYYWDFGDGDIANVSDPVLTHVFSHLGSFNVTLIVTDNDGLTGSLSQVVTVGGRPVTSFDWFPPNPTALETVTFNASESSANGGSITNYFWDFGDGHSQNTSSPITTHVYDNPGEFNVTLTVTDSEGLIQSLTRTIVITSAVKHDITILEVWVNTPHEYPGRIVNVTVVVKNNGEIADSFNITTYRDAVPIGSFAVNNLSVGDSRTAVCPWNTSGLAPYYNWTISAQAPFPGDANPVDNTLVDGQVYVKMYGDVNADGHIDIFDLVAGAIAFGATPSDPRWNPQADLVEEFGLVNVFDLTMVMIHFNEQAPKP